MLVNVGAMLENNDLTGTDVAPQVSVNYRVAPDHVIRVGVSKALRTPTLFEERLPSSIIIGPPPGTIVITQGGLQPESIVSSEIGYLGAWPQWRATLEVKAFYETLRNLIHLTNEGITFPPSAANRRQRRRRTPMGHRRSVRLAPAPADIDCDLGGAPYRPTAPIASAAIPLPRRATPFTY